VIGGRFGSYTAVKRIAIGGMGEIFLARHVGLHGFERLAVIKTVLEGNEEVDRREMFLAEARLAALLNHPNIAQVYELGEQDGTLFLAMEYVEGETVGRIAAEARKAGQLLVWPFVEAVASAARALEFAHQLKDGQGQPLRLVHRDVSPQNIMVRLDGVPKVLDFGIAKVVGASVRTQTGTFKGRPAYMAPEQVQLRELDCRADVFALGVVLWELTTGRRMFPEQSDYNILTHSVTLPRPLPSSVVEGYPPALEAVVMKALALNPGDRWQTAAEFADALDPLLSSAPAEQRPRLGDYVEALVGKKVRERVVSSDSLVAITPSGPGAAAPPEPPEPAEGTPTAVEKRRGDTPRAAPPATLAAPPAPSVVVSPLSPTPPYPLSLTTPLTAAVAAPQASWSWPAALAGLGGLAAVTLWLLTPASEPAAVPPAPPVVTPPNSVVTPPNSVVTPPNSVVTPPNSVVTPPNSVATPPSPVAAPTPDVVVAPVPTAQVTSPPPPARKAPPAVKVTEKSPPRPSRAPAPPAQQPPATVVVAAPAEAAGYLNLAPTPWANAFVDGRFVGVTPKYKLEVAAGAHQVRLETPDGTLKWEGQVQVEPSKTALVQVRLH